MPSQIGKTTMDELAYSINGENVHHGTPANPAAPGRIPSGSSSGSAVRASRARRGVRARIGIEHANMDYRNVQGASLRKRGLMQSRQRHRSQSSRT